MYETHFGITRSPFQLTPDPWFYFDSRGHGLALAAMREGCGPGQAFVVVSGEIGSGKSMLVRSMLDEFGADVVVGYIVSTQLNGEELRRAVGAAFGIPLAGQSIAVWETLFAGLLASLHADGKRAVLIIDEAQHLDRDGLLMLETLAPRSTQARPRLEVWLVGQPELRDLVAAAEVTAFRRRIGVSCHLGPLDAPETQAYIEHRLRKAGWTDRPHFEAEAFEAIFRRTGGLPRQINRLCNRLLLGSFLASLTTIDAVAVSRAARDLEEELQGRESADGFAADDEVPAQAGVATHRASQAAALPPSRSRSAAAPTGHLLCVVGGQADHIKAAALMGALRACAEPLPCTLVRAHRNEALRLHRALFGGLEGADACVELDVTANAQAVQTAHITDRFERLLKERLPCGVVVFDGSELALACTVVASKHGVPSANVGAGVRLMRRTRTGDLTRTLTDRLASLLYTADEASAANLQLDAVPAERLHYVGSVASDVLAIGLRAAAAAAPTGFAGLPAEALSDRRGYGLVVLNQPANVERRERLSDLVQLLRQARRDLPLVWITTRRTEQRLEDFGLAPVIASERIARLPLQPYPEFVQLLNQATCVFSDSAAVNDEALILGVPCLGFFDPADRESGAGARAAIAVGTDAKLATRALWEILYSGGKAASLPLLWDGQASARIAEHLCQWIRGPHVSRTGRGEVTADTF